MTVTNNGEVIASGAALGPAVDVVRHTALELLASLPERPERLRVRAAGVTVDLDWRTLPATPTQAPMVTAATAVTAEQAAHPHPVPPPGAVPGPLADAPPANTHYVCAPTVGTFYHAPEPGAAPFILEGAVVDAGQQVGIIEAMKLMLPVEADRPGRVVEVLVTNGQTVEYGERLLALGPVDPD